LGITKKKVGCGCALNHNTKATNFRRSSKQVFLVITLWVSQENDSKNKICTDLYTPAYTKEKYCSCQKYCQSLKEGAIHFALGFHFSVCFHLPKMLANEFDRYYYVV
jgi:hypothetical protein